MLGTDPTEQLEPVHLGHADVEDDRVRRPLGLDQLEGFGRPTGLLHAVARSLQPSSDEESGAGIVVHDEYPGPCAAGRPHDHVPVHELALPVPT